MHSTLNILFHCLIQKFNSKLIVLCENLLLGNNNAFFNFSDHQKVIISYNHNEITGIRYTCEINIRTYIV